MTRWGFTSESQADAAVALSVAVLEGCAGRARRLRSFLNILPYAAELGSESKEGSAQ